MKTTLMISALVSLALGTGLAHAAATDTATKAAPPAKAAKASKNKTAAPKNAADETTSENCPMPHDKHHAHHKMMNDEKAGDDCDCPHKERSECTRQQHEHHGPDEHHHTDAAPIKDGGAAPLESQPALPGTETAPKR